MSTPETSTYLRIIQLLFDKIEALQIELTAEKLKRKKELEHSMNQFDKKLKVYPNTRPKWYYGGTWNDAPKTK